MLWASTGTKDPAASDVLYVTALAAPHTIATIPEATLRAFAEHGQLGACLPADGGDADAVLGEFAKAGVHAGALAETLQREGAAAFVRSWNDLLTRLTEKSRTMARTG